MHRSSRCRAALCLALGVLASACSGVQTTLPPDGGSEPAFLVTFPEGELPIHLQVYGGTLYYWVAISGETTRRELRSMPLSGGSPTLVYAPGNLLVKSPLSFDGTNVYFASELSVLRCALQGCVGGSATVVYTAPLVTGAAVSSFGIVNGTLFIATTPEGLLACPALACAAPKQLVTTHSSERAFIVEDSSTIVAAYGSSRGRMVARCSATACTEGTLAVSSPPLPKATPPVLAAGRLVWTPNDPSEFHTYFSCQPDGCAGTVQTELEVARTRYYDHPIGGAAHLFLNRTSDENAIVRCVPGACDEGSQQLLSTSGGTLYTADASRLYLVGRRLDLTYGIRSIAF